MARVAVVDDANRFLRWTDREEVHRDHLPHRSVQVLVLDSAGRLILQRRHPTKRTWPDAWDIGCSGHIEEPDYADPLQPDEALPALYEAVAHRELLEELGIDAPLEVLDSYAPLAGVHYEHFVLFRAVHDGPYVPQPEEVSEILAVDPAGLARLADQAVLTSGLRWILGECQRRGWWPLPSREASLSPTPSRGA